MDTWRASAVAPPEISGSLETRFAYTWKTAAGTMFTTTLTTCICLGLTAVSTIPTVRSFGLFGSFLVLVDYIQVTTSPPAFCPPSARLLSAFTRLLPALSRLLFAFSRLPTPSLTFHRVRSSV